MAATATAPTPLKTEKPKFTFRINHGTDWLKVKVLEERDDGTKVQVEKEVPYGPGRPAGDIIHTNTDLRKRHNKRGRSPRYTLIGADGDQRAEELRVTKLQASRAEETNLKLLKALSAEQLRNYAEAEGIDLKGEVRSEEITKLILAKMTTPIV